MTVLWENADKIDFGSVEIAYPNMLPRVCSVDDTQERKKERTKESQVAATKVRTATPRRSALRLGLNIWRGSGRPEIDFWILVEISSWAAFQVPLYVTSPGGGELLD